MLDRRCERVRTAKNAPRGPCRLLERIHGLAEIVERGAGVLVERLRLRRDRDGLLVFFVGVVLLRVAAAVYFLTHLLVAAAPVVMLASRIAIASVTSNATRSVVGQWGGAGGAVCEDHFGVAFCFEAARGGSGVKTTLLVSYMPLANRGLSQTTATSRA